MPGGGAEIFDATVRKMLCAEKITGKRWLEVIKAAHHVGFKTNATMLYGHIETYEHRIDHCSNCAPFRTRPAASRHSFL